MGTTVNLAARMESAAPPGGVLISHETYQHVRGLFEVEGPQAILVKGSATPIDTYTILGVRPRSFHVRSRGIEGVETRLVGRQAELARLHEGWQKVQEVGRFLALTITGEAGVGKTRLLYEFEREVENTAGNGRIYKGRATPESQNLPGGLIRDIFTLALNIQESDSGPEARRKLEEGFCRWLGEKEGDSAAHFIGQFIGFDYRSSPHLARIMQEGQPDARQLRDRAGLALRNFFSKTAADNPVLILLEDIHWADNSSLEMLTDLAKGLARQPVMVVGLTRPTIFERMAGWGSDFPGHERLDLRPLSPDDSQHLIHEILRKVQQVPDALRDLVVNKAEGNPFYLEEIIKMLIEDGVIIKGTPFWWVEPARLDTERIPTTLSGILQTSLDRLSPEERTILQQASVVGRTFWDAVVARINEQVNEAITADEVQKALDMLRGKEMIFRRETSAFARAQELIFKHAILREVTYESVLKRVRRTYHALVADWLIENSGERSGEYTGLIAEHLERAGDRERAVDYLALAGRQAAGQYANLESAAYFGRAIDLTLPEEVDRRAELFMAREAIYDLRGEREAQLADLKRLEAVADDLAVGVQAQIALRRANYAGLMNDYAATIEAAQEGIGLAQIAGETGRQAEGYLQWGWALRRQGQNEEAQLQMTQALELARQAGLRQVEADSLRSLGVAFDKDGYPEQAYNYYEQALALYRRIGDRRGEGRALSGLGNLANELRDFEKAKDYYGRNLAIAQEIGDRSGEGWACWWLGSVCHQAGDYGAAMDYYGRSLAVRREIGDQPAVALTLTHLGRTAQFQGLYDEARAYCQEALDLYLAIGDLSGVGWGHWWLAGICHQQADFSAARNAYEQVLKIRRELGNDQNESATLGRLGQVCLEMGDYEAALGSFKEAQQLNRENGDRWGEGYSLNYLGNVYCELGDFERARGYYEESLTIRERLGPEHMVCEPLAGLALVSLEMGELDEAMGYVERVWPYIERPTLSGVTDLLRVYLACVRVLRAGEDGRFGPLLRRANELLEERSGRITNEVHRKVYLEDVATNRELRSLALEIG
jgi:predicted ATPase